MVKASDTLMDETQIREVLQASPRGANPMMTSLEIALQAQAEVSFKAGITEVVKFVSDKIFPLLDMASVSVYFKDLWNTKLKEWGQ